MSESITELVDHIIRVLVIFIVLISVLYVSMYWLVWNNAKLSLGKAMAEIESEMDIAGVTDTGHVAQMMGTYCNWNAIQGYEIVEMDPAPGSIGSGYVGQPLYVEVRMTYKVAGKEHTITGKASAYNRGLYGKGYNTIIQH